MPEENTEPPIMLDTEQIELALTALSGLRAQINAMIDNALTANSKQTLRAVQWLGAIAQTERRMRAVLEYRKGREGGAMTAAPLHEQGTSAASDTVPRQAPPATCPQGGDLGG